MSVNRPIAVVTGAGSGIGRAIAQRLGNEGYHIVVVDMSEVGASTTVNLLREAGISANYHVLDLTNQQAVREFAAQQERVDVLVNNAGIFTVKAFEDLSVDDFRRMNEVNVVALFDLSQQLLSSMPDGARIVNLASRAALGARTYAHYAASKGAVVSLTRAMALDLSHRKITVNAVAPGVIQTDMLLERDDLHLLCEQQPLGVLGIPEDIAHAVAYFADPRSSFVTGQVLLVDGGRSIGGTMAF